MRCLVFFCFFFAPEDRVTGFFCIALTVLGKDFDYRCISPLTAWLSQHVFVSLNLTLYSLKSTPPSLLLPNSNCVNFTTLTSSLVTGLFHHKCPRIQIMGFPNRTDNLSPNPWTSGRRGLTLESHSVTSTSKRWHLCRRSHTNTWFIHIISLSEFPLKF